MEERYLQLFTSQPYEDQEDKDRVVQDILTDPMVKDLFQLS